MGQERSSKAAAVINSHVGGHFHYTIYVIKIWTIIFFLGLWTTDSFGQDSPCDSVYTIVDQTPAFGKGQEDLLRYLMKNLRFKTPCRPEELRQLTWTVNKEGKMVDIGLIGLQGKCREGIIEQLKSFPTWTPGRLNGKAVCVRMILPMHIRPSE